MTGFSTNRNRAQVENRGSGPGARRRRSSSESEMRRVQVQTTERVHRAFKMEAAKRGVALFDLLRDAVSEWLDCGKPGTRKGGGGDARIAFKLTEEQRMELYRAALEDDATLSSVCADALELKMKEFGEQELTP